MPEKKIKTIAILGAGHGGCASAADLTLRGYDVRLQARREQRLEPIRQKGGLEITGGVHQGFVALRNLTTRVAEAIEGADLIMLVVPAVGLAYYAQELAPLLSPERIIFLHPGQTGGGLHFLHALRTAGYPDDIQLCETASLTQGCRLLEPTRVYMPGYLRNLGWSALPGRHAERLFSVLRPVYPHLVRMQNTLETSLANANMVMHPPGMVMNAGWIQQTAGDFYFYREGITEAVGQVMAAIEAERIRIGAALGVRTQPLLEMLRDMGVVSEASLQTGNFSTALRSSEMASAIRSPSTLEDRYIHEDVGYGLVPLAEFGTLLRISTPTIDALIHLASLAGGVDFKKDGLTLERMGLADVQPSDLEQFLWEGK
jgi:opine dehydrogenase